MNTTHEDREFLSLGETARILELSVDTLRRYEDLGVVTYRRIAGRRVVTQTDLAAIRAHRQAIAERGAESGFRFAHELVLRLDRDRFRHFAIARRRDCSPNWAYTRVCR
jgi:hypothetical protein